MRKGNVYINDRLCGQIWEDDGNFYFVYLKQWLNDPNKEPVSLTLPLQEATYESNILFPFFDGLIPEGYLLEIALKRFHLSLNDRMALLLKTCVDTIGNVSVKEAISDE